ncbi:hypothetical protein BDY21DRAFT_136436 [Lineolata rhizophorae]|uniref:WD40-repeat-containing domain protein n=1 Tax=Lineolata rhizophorae TaxID=578093 RepID=A0A6A6PB68_9PEZI|nr:hypothetical protein BDY21DRAFT_136436 [Lineolata rhizophorae]
MGRKPRQRISYVLPLAESAGGHRLGVNGLAVDAPNSILYSGGRDGVVCAWDLNVDLRSPADRDLSSPFGSTVPGVGPNAAAASNAAAAAAAAATAGSNKHQTPPTTFRQQVQAHTHWINDIVLVQSNSALVSASSDISVKLWRPAAEDVAPPQTIGLHSDYVKCLASPGPHADWVASGGLDRKISLWDLDGAGQKLEIPVVEDESTAKGSVYALGATNSMLASGGPESIVRVWDPRSGKRVTKLVGHTDNIRDVLIARDNDTVVTASSDQTVKVWSMTAGRCMYTLTMHNDSVWSLHSSHPQLSVLYSSDRSGLVAKTDVRGCVDWDEGLSVAVAREHEGVIKVAHAGDFVWTATSSSSINRWRDVDTEADVAVPEPFRMHRPSFATSRSATTTATGAASSRYPSSPTTTTMMTTTTAAPATTGPANGSTAAAPQQFQIPANSVLRLSNAAPFPVFQGRDEASTLTSASGPVRKPSEIMIDQLGPVAPVRDLPDYTIEGQNGLIKHVLLNDRRRVLTLDTAGEVVMWDLIQCAPVRSFGKRHVEDVAREVNTTETVAHWCAVDTRTGSLTCVLEENYCFDAEMYADELKLEEKIEFREDQRINLGKWVLRYLFSNLIDEEIRRDEAFRQQLLNERRQQSIQRSNMPGTIQLPQANMNGWNDTTSGPTSASTLRASNGYHRLPVTTPGLAIGVATPAAGTQSAPFSSSTLPSTAEEGSNLEQTASDQGQATATDEKQQGGDYFSSAVHAPGSQAPTTPGDVNGNKSAESQGGETPQTPAYPATTPTAGDAPPDSREPATTPGATTPASSSAIFGKKFRMSFGMKKLGKTVTSESKTSVAGASAGGGAGAGGTGADEKSEDSDSRSSNPDGGSTHERVFDDNLGGVVQRIRQGYEDALHDALPPPQQQHGGQGQQPQTLNTAITPSLPNETPVIKPPPNTTILIQEDSPGSGGVADLWEGTVGGCGEQADFIERVAPSWLGDVLLRNIPPQKDIVKVSFVLEPYQGLLPSIASDGLVHSPSSYLPTKVRP